MSVAFSQDEADALFAELAGLSGVAISADDWADLLSNEPDDARELVAGWQALGRLDWAKQQSAADRALEILNVIAQWAGPIGVIAGAVTGVGGVIAGMKA